MIPQTDLSEWGSDGLLKDPVGVTRIPPRRPVNFYAQAADLVTLAVVSPTRNGQPWPLTLKNTLVLYDFHDIPLSGPSWPHMPSRCLPNAPQMAPDVPQMACQVFGMPRISDGHFRRVF